MKGTSSKIFVASLVGCIVVCDLVEGFTPQARWGSASTIYTPSSSNPTLLLLSGKSDPSSQYTYSSSPSLTSTTTFTTSSSSDSSFLGLSLASDFDTSNPPWVGLAQSGGDVPTSAWGVMSGEVVFGGDGGTGLAVQTGNDSFYTYTLPSSTLTSTSSITFSQAAAGTDGQPIRMIYSAISTSADGSTSYITGGMKDDGSGVGYNTAYMVTGSTFTALPSLPITLAHHKTVLLANGTLLTVGGYNPTSGNLVGGNTAYRLDTGDTSAGWTQVSLGGGTTSPAGRRGHSAVLLNIPASTTTRRRRGMEPRGTSSNYAETIAVFGGTSGSLSAGTPLSDLWTLDLSASNPSWVSVSSTSGPSARLDAASQPLGYQMLVFGGYGASSPADNALYIFNAVTGGWEDSYDSTAIAYTPQALASSGSTVSTGTGGINTATKTATGKVTATGGTTVAWAGIFPTGSATVANLTMETATGKTGGTKTNSATTSTSSASSTPATVQNLSSTGKTAAAVGGSVGGLAAIVGVIAILLLVRRRKRNGLNRDGRFQPYGGRKPASGYRRKGEGAEGLIPVEEKDCAWEPEDYLAISGEKRMTPLMESSEYSGGGSTMGVNGRGGGIRPVVMARYSGDEEGGVGRRDMLSDEDKSYRRGPSGSGSGSSEDYGYMDEEDIAGAALLEEEDLQRRGTSGIVAPARNPSRHSRLMDPFEESYGAPVLDYVYGGAQYLDVPSSGSRDDVSPTSSGGISSHHGAVVETARKVSMMQGNASLVPAPVKRGQSMLQRLHIPNPFTSSTSSNTDNARQPFPSHAEERRFLDPSTPPVMTPLVLASDQGSYTRAGGPSTWTPGGQVASNMTTHGRSASSLVTNRTATSDQFDKYGRMNIVQRERTYSGPTATGTGDIDAGGSDVGTVEYNPPPAYAARGRTSKELPTRPRPASPSKQRPSSTPRGPRPVSPTHSRPSSPTRLPQPPPMISTPSRRHVKEIAASINRRAPGPADPAELDMFTPSPVMASVATLSGGSGAQSLGGPRAMIGPRSPGGKKTYEYQSRGVLQVANR